MRARPEEPFIVVAANRGLVRLRDGRVGKLVWWSAREDSCTVVINRRHIRLNKKEVVKILQDRNG